MATEQLLDENGTVVPNHYLVDGTLWVTKEGQTIEEAMAAPLAPDIAAYILKRRKEYPSVGTTTLNTDLKAYVSRDNGTTYTQATLTGKGSYSGTTQIASVHNLDISGQPAGTSMRWKVETLNQSQGVKVTRLNGMSLGWS